MRVVVKKKSDLGGRVREVRNESPFERVSRRLLRIIPAETHRSVFSQMIDRTSLYHLGVLSHTRETVYRAREVHVTTVVIGLGHHHTNDRGGLLIL